MARFNSPFQDPNWREQGQSESPLSRWDMGMVFPGQAVVESRYTGRREVIGRGPGLFAGSCTWIPRTDDGRREIEQLMFKLQGGIHTTQLWLPARYQKQSSLPTGTNELSTITAVSVEAATGIMSLSFTTVSLTSTITAGDFVNINGRLYNVLRFTQTGTGSGPYTIEVVPNARPAVGDVISRGQPFVEVRSLSDGQGEIQASGWRLRPVSFDWVEAV